MAVVARAWEVEVEVRCLRRPIHSGRGGGAVPDPVQILCRLIARLPPGPRVGRIEAPALVGSINQITDAVRARLHLPARSGAAGRAAARRLARRLRRRPPHGARVRVRIAWKPVTP